MYDARVDESWLKAQEGWAMLTSTSPLRSAEERAEYWTLRTQEANLANRKKDEMILSLQREIAKLKGELRGKRAELQQS